MGCVSLKKKKEASNKILMVAFERFEDIKSIPNWESVRLECVSVI